MFYEIGPWKVKVTEDIEIYSSDKRNAELIPHSQYGYRFREDSSLAEKTDLLRQARPEIEHLVYRGEVYDI